MTTPIQLYTNTYQQSYPVSPPTTPKEELTTSARLLMHHTTHPEFNKKYILGQELGSGGFGFVVSAYERQTGIERAVKFIIRDKVPSNAWIRDPEMGPIPMEIYTLKHVRHSNIIRFFDAYQDNTFFYLVMELHGTQWAQSQQMTSIHSPALSHTSDSTIDEEEHEATNRQFVRRTSCDLFECIEQHRHFEEGLAKKIFRQIVDCVAYLDSVGICHRDIKDENIVIDHEYKVILIGK
jgi:serine/threonine protein kinase